MPRSARPFVILSAPSVILSAAKNLLFLAVFAAAVPAAAQAPAKKVLTVNDYSRWKQIDGAQISPDGNWVVYGLTTTNVAAADAKPVLHLLNLGTSQDVAVTNASRGTFSADSKWLVYQIDSTPARGGRGGRGGTAPADTTAGRANATPALPPRRFELRELATGRTQAWADMASATFSANASHLVLKRRPPTPAGGAPAAGAAPATPLFRLARAAPTSSCSISPPTARSYSAPWPTSPSIRRATCWPTPSTRISATATACS